MAPTKYQTGPRTNPNDLFAAACPQRSQMQPNFFLTSFCTVESFNYPGYIVPTSTDSVQHRWPPGFSESDLFSLLDLFTQLDHRHCTFILNYFYISVCNGYLADQAKGTIKSLIIHLNAIQPKKELSYHAKNFLGA